MFHQRRIFLHRSCATKPHHLRCIAQLRVRESLGVLRVVRLSIVQNLPSWSNGIEIGPLRRRRFRRNGLREILLQIDFNSEAKGDNGSVDAALPRHNVVQRGRVVRLEKVSLLGANGRRLWASSKRRSSFVAVMAVSVSWQ